MISLHLNFTIIWWFGYPNSSLAFFKFWLLSKLWCLLGTFYLLSILLLSKYQLPIFNCFSLIDWPVPLISFRAFFLYPSPKIWTFINCYLKHSLPSSLCLFCSQVWTKTHHTITSTFRSTSSSAPASTLTLTPTFTFLYFGFWLLAVIKTIRSKSIHTIAQFFHSVFSQGILFIKTFTATPRWCFHLAYVYGGTNS